MTTILLRFVLPLVLLAGGVGIFAVVGQREEPESRLPSEASSAPRVTTATIEPHHETLDIDTDGVVVPFREITRAAEVSGNIIYKSPACNEGTFVTEGSTLIEIDPRDYQSEVQRWQAELDQAKASLGELEVELADAEKRVPLAARELELWQSQLERTEGLRARGSITAQDVETAERNVITARKSQLEAIRLRDALLTRKDRLVSAIDVAAAQLQRAELNLERTKIKAPVSGVIISDNVEQDTYVQAGATLFTIDDTTKVEIRCNLTMDELQWALRQPDMEGEGKHVTEHAANELVSSHALPSTPVTVVYELGNRRYMWSGRLDRFDGLGLDERTRMAPCRIVVERPRVVHLNGEPTSSRAAPTLVRGMFVGVDIHVEPVAELLRVPEKAIQPGNIVWAVRDGKLQRVAAKIVQSDPPAVIVDGESSGLSVGDRVVVSPLQVAYTGLEVREEAAE